ncbi:hypothetical protein [Streptomyces syringium]|uniref:hypothetical protein n=1 Tax=Streptomyces syringium TaxID=76729 RepID=UPI003AB07C0E
MRYDVRRMLIARGWAQDGEWFMRKNNVLWTETAGRASGLDGPDGRYVVEFASDVPARVIVAACEAAANTGPTQGSAA